MAVESFRDWKPSPEKERLVMQVQKISRQFGDMGYNMTLRQIYYQLVGRNIIENSANAYKALSATLTRARTSGWLDWDSIEDRTRSLHGYEYADDMSDFLREQSQNYWLDHWKAQEYRVEVWVEKDALMDVVGQVANRYHVDYLSCRGYASVSLLKDAADRFKRYNALGQKVAILYLGDHDPSGLDMPRDIVARLEMLGAPEVQFNHIGLSMEQIELYNLPPNPIKQSDVRSRGYSARLGSSSWELDAMPPDKLAALIASAILEYADGQEADRIDAIEVERRVKLERLGARFDQISDFLEAFDEDADPRELAEELADYRADATRYKVLSENYAATADENASLCQQAIDKLRTEQEQRTKEVGNLTRQLEQIKTMNRQPAEALPFKLGHVYTFGRASRIYRGSTNGWLLYGTLSKPEETKAGRVDDLLKFFEQAEEGEKYD